mmetsp:Transcript_52010/g.59393  ORF Transcript_52010/g.59393 Transcript_52010/m.59393 type:complete len:614 (-) Transcript_52010:509-2350(-)|eukprot:CAMPEP_0115008086 /NCGR_PEP_ID=MMETSP0216-20121206/21665_1 /TAXON_ID=223996 /ORGANISM="Protocruzia adherens, Strain Boccale" /LENGTH=613 /DNA_ID=CAMNT_0002375351 /DNA_START=653 /DNA_END=2494 /DNA_ORIENTATION=+
MSLKEFTIIKKLGEGAYSTVYKVKRHSNNEVYALKKVKLGPLSAKEKENSLNEVRILASISHSNIIGYKEAFIEDSVLCIVMEYAQGGDLYQKILSHQKKRTHFSESELWQFGIQMVQGLKSLHDLKILHRDLKCANVFLDKDLNVKLGDLNVSKVAKKGLLYTQTGTPYYASPEVWRDQPYNSKSDIWSLGCVLYECCTMKPPFRADDMQGLFRKVQKGVYAPIPTTYSNELSNFLKSMLQVNPTLRPSCDQILQLPSVQKRLTKVSITENNPSSNDSGAINLLNTIKIPKNLNILANRLPKPQYDKENLSRQESKKAFREIAENVDPNIERAAIFTRDEPRVSRSNLVSGQQQHRVQSTETRRNYYKQEMRRTPAHVHIYQRPRPPSNEVKKRNGGDGRSRREYKEMMDDGKLPQIDNRHRLAEKVGIQRADSMRRGSTPKSRNERTPVAAARLPVREHGHHHSRESSHSSALKENYSNIDPTRHGYQLPIGHNGGGIGGGNRTPSGNYQGYSGNSKYAQIGASVLSRNNYDYGSNVGNGIGGSRNYPNLYNNQGYVSRQGSQGPQYSNGGVSSNGRLNERLYLQPSSRYGYQQQQRQDTKNYRYRPIWLG